MIDVIISHISDVWIFIKSNTIPLGFLITLIAGLFEFWRYLDIRSQELRQRRFENYHELIKRLNVPLYPGEDRTYFNIQQAVVFELQNYPEYKEITKEIFGRWIDADSGLTELMKNTLKILYPKGI